MFFFSSKHSNIKFHVRFRSDIAAADALTAFFRATVYVDATDMQHPIHFGIVERFQIEADIPTLFVVQRQPRPCVPWPSHRFHEAHANCEAADLVRRVLGVDATKQVDETRYHLVVD